MGDASTNRLLYAACAIAFAVVLFNQLTRERPPARERVVATDTLTRYARSTLEGLQQRSLANNQEYCGVIFEDYCVEKLRRHLRREILKLIRAHACIITSRRLLPLNHYYGKSAADRVRPSFSTQ